jgi:hypothetical protein
MLGATPVQTNADKPRPRYPTHRGARSFFLLRACSNAAAAAKKRFGKSHAITSSIICIRPFFSHPEEERRRTALPC